MSNDLYFFRRSDISDLSDDQHGDTSVNRLTAILAHFLLHTDTNLTGTEIMYDLMQIW